MQPDRGGANVEPGRDLAYIKRHKGRLEGAFEVGQFGLSFGPDHSVALFRTP